MAYNLTFTSTAGSDLDEILRYMSKELANPGAASAFLTRLEKVIFKACEGEFEGL